jgi:hypothetical protein
MISNRFRKALIPVLLVSLLVACAPKEASRYDQVQQETSQKGSQAVADDAQKGGSFNKFFPKSTGEFSVVPAQEKKGFAEYKLNRAGKNVAMLSVNDTLGTPTADKYKQSTFKVAGYPAVDQGQTGTAILVGDRYQVKALSRDPSFTKQDRIAWLQKFNLNGLSQLK